ncbi:MAG: alpha-N-arabinofuranosidase, partial [Marivirga sp.]|nr:alpha-N-arabinofuranosidase [Marivirga sp.]
YYVNEYKKYATLMTSYSNTERLFRIAVGPGTPDFNWTETLMKNIPKRRIEGVSIHHYSVINWAKKGSATQFAEEEYFRTMEEAYKMESLVARNKEVMDKYDPEKRIALIVDEWGGWYDVEPGTNSAFLYQQNSMRDAMIAGLTLNIFNNHCDRVRMANLAQTINVLQAVLLTNEQKIVLTPTYHVMEMYNVHQDALMIPLTITSSDYSLGEKKIKAVSASASKDKNGLVHISLVNIHATKEQEITVDLGSLSVKSVSGRILRSNALQDHNTFDAPDKVKPMPFNTTVLKGNKLTIKIPAFSAVVLELR